MDWLFQPWGVQAPFGGSYDPLSWTHDEDLLSLLAGLGGRAQPTPLDMWLIELTYTVVAEQSSCGKCDAQLGRRISVRPSPPGSSSWQATVAIRCRGWRRHRHLAEVAEVSKDLRLGPLHVA